MPIPLLGLAAGLISPIVGAITGAGQRRAARKIKVNDPTYQVSPFAQQQYQLAQQGFNARMAGAGQMEQNIFTNQANTMGSVNRNATDASQALALAGSVQGGTNDAFANLGLQEMQNRQMQQGNLNQALGIMTNEEDKVFGDKLRKAQEAQAAKNALMQAGMTNQGNALNSISNMGIMGAMGMFGDVKLPGIGGNRSPKPMPGGVFNPGNIADLNNQARELNQGISTVRGMPASNPNLNFPGVQIPNMSLLNTAMMNPYLLQKYQKGG